jgi:hypothetical protein
VDVGALRPGVGVGPGGFDVVVVRIEHERDIIGVAPETLVTESWRTVVATGIRKGSFIEGVDGLRAVGGEGQVDGRRAWAIARPPIARNALPGARDEQEAALTGRFEEGGVELGHVLDPLNPKLPQAGGEEGKAYARIADEEADVIEHENIIVAQTVADKHLRARRLAVVRRVGAPLDAA